MARIWKIVRHGSSEKWEESLPENSVTEGQLVARLSHLAASHLPPAAVASPHRNALRYTTSLTVKNDRFGNKRLIMYASGSPVHYIATLEDMGSSNVTSLTGLGYRVAVSVYSEDGKRAADICEFSNGETYLDEKEWVEGTTFRNRHGGRLAGPFNSPEEAEKFIVTTEWFLGRA